MRGRSKGLWFGGILVAAGVVLLMERFGILQTDLLRYWWPVTLMAVGALKLLENNDSSRIAGAALLVAGIAFQVSLMGIVHLSWSQIWPIAVIVVGGLMLWRAVARPDPVLEARMGVEETTLNEFAIFGGGEVKVTSPIFAGGSVTAIFGGFEIDLRQATMRDAQAAIRVEVIFGGVEMRVPEHWRVQAHAGSIFGGFSVKTVDPVDPGAPVLIVRGSPIFGGVEIKN